MHTAMIMTMLNNGYDDDIPAESAARASPSSSMRRGGRLSAMLVLGLRLDEHWMTAVAASSGFVIKGADVGKGP